MPPPPRGGREVPWTWLCCDILDAEVQIPNFTVFREDRADNSQYGVLLSMFTTRCRQRG